MCTIYDQNGSARSNIDNWRDDYSALDLEQNKIAPAEAATILHLPVSAYSAATAGADGGTGVGLVEICNLE